MEGKGRRRNGGMNEGKKEAVEINVVHSGLFEIYNVIYLETNLNVLFSGKRHTTFPFPFQTTNILTKDFE